MRFLSLVFQVLAVFLLGGASLVADADPGEPLACPLGWSAVVQKKAGSGPSCCSMPTCRPASASAHGHATRYVQNPLCNPLAGPCDMVLAWHYDYSLSCTPSGACAGDIVAGPWSTKSN